MINGPEGQKGKDKTKWNGHIFNPPCGFAVVGVDRGTVILAGGARLINLIESETGDMLEFVYRGPEGPGAIDGATYHYHGGKYYQE